MKVISLNSVFDVTSAGENLKLNFIGQQETLKKKGLYFDNIVQIKSQKKHQNKQ